MKQYQYTLLKQDGTTEDLGTGKQRKFDELYKILDCDLIEIIPSAYWTGKGYGKCNMYGDEEGRFKGRNHRNPHFTVLYGNPDLGEPAEWDVVGDIIMEKKV